MKQPKTNFDWSKWDSNWKWAAKNASGDIYVFTNKPVDGFGYWQISLRLPSLGLTNHVSHSSVFIEGDWKESLISREAMQKLVPEKRQLENPSAFTEDNFKLFINSLPPLNRGYSTLYFNTFKEWLSSRKPVNTNEQRAKGFLESKGWKVEKC